MLLKQVSDLLKHREFISVATSDLGSNPNAAPKFFLKVEGHFIYLIDYSIGKTCRNLKDNPKVSLSFMDTENLIGYQINGIAQIIETGLEFERILKEMLEREISLSTKRIIEGISQGKRHSTFEVAISDKFIILKIEMKELVELGHKGELRRETLC